jgi:hypothetical protein
MPDTFAEYWLLLMPCTREPFVPDLAATFFLGSSIYVLSADRDFLRRVNGQADPTLAYVHDPQLNVGADQNPFARFSAQD